jgi:hypothetical protein
MVWMAGQVVSVSSIARAASARAKHGARPVSPSEAALVCRLATQPQPARAATHERVNQRVGRQGIVRRQRQQRAVVNARRQISE